MASARLRGPGTGSVALYWAIAPQIATRPCSRSAAERRLQVVAADVVEVDVDAVRRGLRQLTRRTGWSR